jgi:hypothetical protein
VRIDVTHEGQLLLFTSVPLSFSHLRSLTFVPIFGINSFGYLSNHF